MATNRSKDDLINESTGLYKDNTAGDISASDLRDGIYSIFQPQSICNGRLTLESGVPVSTTDQTAKTTIYFTPYLGNCIGLYDGTSWKLHTFTERSLALGTLTSGLNYDVFIYDNAGTLTLELTAWTNDSTRATALTTQDGVYVKTGATTRRYLGTMRTTSTTTTEDSAGGTTSQTGGKRFVWNAYNQVLRDLCVIDTTNSWTYATTSYRQSNNASGNKVEVVIGVAQRLRVMAVSYTDTSLDGLPQVIYGGIGMDSTTVNAAQMSFGGTPSSTGGGFAFSYYDGTLTAGYHAINWLEKGTGGTQNWYGDAGLSGFQLGMKAWVYA
jgi:hypothetical protein